MCPLQHESGLVKITQNKFGPLRMKSLAGSLLHRVKQIHPEPSIMQSTFESGGTTNPYYVPWQHPLLSYANQQQTQMA